jgi:hypothetical protein
MSNDGAPRRLLGRLFLLQGGYYLITGIWPFVSIRSFEAITGPKVDRWLVKTVAVLVSVVGGVLLLGGVRRQADAELSLLACGSALGLAAVESTYSLRRRISILYLLDALLELALAAAFARAWTGKRRSE